MPQPNCGTCRFWKPDYIVADTPCEQGTCRFDPPQICVVADERYALWPDVDTNEWCGRHSYPSTGLHGR